VESNSGTQAKLPFTDTEYQPPYNDNTENTEMGNRAIEREITVLLNLPVLFCEE
jgi:hypothetical protein